MIERVYRRTAEAARPRVGALLALGCLTAALWPARTAAQNGYTDAPLSYSRTPVFYIPFSDPGDRRLKSVQLYVSTDQGRFWQRASNVGPQEGRFTFTAPRDGLYWFAVQTVDADNRVYPAVMDNAPPGLRVIVDTQPPVVTLRAQPPRDGYSGVEWEVQDENLDVGTLTLEYRQSGAADWLPLRVDPVATGHYSWRPAAGGTLEARLRVRDKAGNEGERQATVLAAADSRVGSPDLATHYAPRPPASSPLVKLVNSKRINLNYEVQDKGPSGLSKVELWYTTDTRKWERWREDTNPQAPFTVEVNDEGVYGFTLLALSGVGLGTDPPRVGDPPQVWVEVDLTKPIVRLLGVDVGRGSDAGKLTVAWSATDKNLGRQPISLFYSDQPAGGTWKPIITNAENSGSYVWRIPSDVPYKFYVRIEAADKAGNVGAAETDKAVIVDLSQPKIVIREVEPKK
jgi:hypothetical protein